ncbi:hypothetical protein GCK32_009379 [Trichostrongylus colubriformis]|uniref:Uncharacterized protein n=1 Tax=Trichostrongylus colubriformis TaxID=6319 RepID=A0AAN8FKV7_TRICO
MSMHFGLLILVPCISSLQFTNPCEKSSQTVDASDFTKLIDHLNYSVNYKVDPCEDFYQFSCGNWIANTNDTLMNWEEISPFSKMYRLYEEDQIKALNSTEQSKSDAITQARRLYRSCIRAEEEWNSTGVSGIDYVMSKIRKFGIFPMLSEEPFDEAQFNAEFDFTWLLAYFNQDDTVLDFVPRVTLLSYHVQDFTRKLQMNFTELLLRLMKLIAADKGINYRKTNTQPDILALRIFMSKIYALPRSLPISMNLSQVDGTIYKANWTEYLFLTAPPIVHPYIAEDPTVAVRSKEYIEKLNEVLNETSPRTLTNYAVLGKISRITWSLLDDDLFHNDTALDELYSAHYGLSDQPFLEMLAKINLLRKTEDYLRLTTSIDQRSYETKFSTAGYDINAFYLPDANHIMVPLPFLQFPVFDESFPRSYLYGSVGSIIGHEISHSLDVQGRLYDGNGEKREWWKKTWTEEYDKRALCYKEQYDKVKIPIFNISLNGTITLAENIADNEGMKISYRAYKKYAAKLKDPAKSESLHGFTQDQLYFLGFSQKFCRKTAEFTLYEELFDSHAPSEFRADMVSKNFPPFASAFHCSSKSRMNAEHRCSIW